MSERPVFQRAPRLFPDLPSGEVAIPAPPAPPSESKTSLIAVILPGLMAVGMLIVTVTSAATANMAMALLSFGFMGISSLVSIGSFFAGKMAYKKAVSERTLKYRTLLKNRREQLAPLREQQRRAYTQTDPEPPECLARVERRDRRLWERGLDDIDLLALRLGLGKLPFRVLVRPPQPEGAVEPDPLIVEAQALAREFSQIDGLPILLPLVKAGSAGLAGPRAAVLETVRALCLQLATQQSPDEVKIVAVFPADETAEWHWLRWLPHVWTPDRQHRYLARERDAAHALLTSLYELLMRRRPLPGAELPGAQKPLPLFVVFLADPRLAENEPILQLLCREGAALGAYPVFLADNLQSLPKECQAVVELQGNQGRLIQTDKATQQMAQTPFLPDAAPVGLAEQLARTMAPIRLLQIAKPTEIPRSVPLLGLLRVEAVDELDLPSLWRTGEPFRSLAVPIGLRAGAEPLLMDLHEKAHGPHGLVAGTTGSGKSELLQSLVASLAVRFSPHEVAFVIIDYKGGGTANVFAELPHLVGTITNLQGNLADRALAALKSELERRQTLLAKEGLNHVDDYQKRYRQGTVKEPLPHLIIIADEFAELVKEQPEFIRELVSAVRVGRSLGVHLILATQNPAGVVNEQISSNSRFRLCLRVARPEDSQEVIKRPEAASLTGAGRAYFQVGNNEVFELFQAAWGGAPYAPGGSANLDPHEVVEVTLDGGRHALRLSPNPQVIQTTGTQLQALVGYIRDVAAKQGLARLPGPWLPPLPKAVQLGEVRPAAGWDGQSWQPATGWLEPVLGLVDDPVNQFQGPLRINLAREGHLVVYGTQGVGKTTFLQTLVTSLACDYSPQDVQFYLLDFAGRLLTLFAPLPHVGGVILTDEAERLNRLLRHLLRELERRKQRFAEAGVQTLASYRSASREPLPAIVILLDSYTGFTTTYPDAEDTLAQITREGGNLGLHLVLTANSPSTLRAKLSNNITLAVALQLADRSEYGPAVGRGLDPAPLPGRALIKGNPPLEFQTALPSEGDSEVERTHSLRALIAQMAQAWRGPRPKPVPVLPDVVPLCELLPPAGAAWPPLPGDGSLAVPLGVDADDLDPLPVDLHDGPHFVVTGPMQSGKTTCLQTWLLALAERFPPARLELWLVDFRRTGLFPLRQLPQVRRYIEDDDGLGEALAEIAESLRARRGVQDEARRAGSFTDERSWLAGYPAIVMAIDDFDLFVANSQSGTRERLEQIVRREKGLGFHLLLAGPSGDLGNSWEGLAKALKELQTGILLGSSDHSDLQIFNLRLPSGEAGRPLPVGQGFYARRGRYRKIKVATCHAGATMLGEWVRMILRRVPDAPQE